jgi:hypothetical protein
MDFTEKSGQSDGFLESAETMMREAGIEALINPFLRKTRFYIFRHDMEDARASSIIAKDILSAARKLLPLMKGATRALRDDR